MKNIYMQCSKVTTFHQHPRVSFLDSNYLGRGQKNVLLHTNAYCVFLSCYMKTHVHACLAFLNMYLLNSCVLGMYI